MIEVHPAANAYRLMTADETEGLAESIKANGLRDPLTIGLLNGHKWLVDGRNRTKACEIAGVEPRYEEIRFADEDELRAFVADRNERRNITVGQKAMGYARLFPGPAKLKRKTDVPSGDNSFSKQSLSEARAVLEFSEEWADEVTEGAMSLNEAFGRVQTERQRKATDAERLAELSLSTLNLKRALKDGAPLQIASPSLPTLLARQLTKSTVLSAQISTLDTSADLPSAYVPRRST